MPDEDNADSELDDDHSNELLEPGVASDANTAGDGSAEDDDAE